MKSSNLVFLVLGVTIIFYGCSKDDSLTPESDLSDQVTTSLKSAAKLSAHLTGAMDLYFNPGVFVDPTEPVWEGTIVLEGQGEYGMRFFSLSAPRDYSQARPFEEYFEIFEIGDETVVLAGHDAGVSTLANSKYRMNGEIEVATEPFEMWLGRGVHMSGIITWQDLGTPEAPFIVPATAPGTFRIN